MEIVFIIYISVYNNENITYFVELRY